MKSPAKVKPGKARKVKAFVVVTKRGALATNGYGRCVVFTGSSTPLYVSLVRDSRFVPCEITWRMP